MEHLTALAALEHSCSLCSDRKEELRIWELRNNQNVCRRAHFLYACVNAVQPLLHNAGYADRVIEEDGIIRVKLRSYKPRNGRHYPYGCDHRVDFECLMLDGSASRDKPVLCAEAPRLRQKRSKLPGNTSSDHTFETIRQWIKICTTTHPRCDLPSLEKVDTTLEGVRFLSLQDGGIRLVQDFIPDRFACLSHRWGSGPQAHLTLKKNLETYMKHGIPSAKLPLTFQHAVHICRTLGIMYLWIDCLCIVQDDHEDWCAQAVKMGDIYERAFVTIAASSAAGPSHGCFSDTEDVYLGTRIPEYPGVMIRRIPPLPGVITDVHGEEDWPLSQRGWIYQEMALSRRILHYGAQEVLWQCRTSNERECESVWSASVSNMRQGQDRSVFDFGPSQRDGLTQEDRWRSIVQRYTSRHLTFHSDRLPAIAAVARRVHALRQDDQYLAGLWRRSLLSDLLWASYSNSLSYEQRKHGLPTWSWASVTGEVHYGQHIDHSGSKFPLKNVEILDIDYRVAGSEYLDDVERASITIRAPIFRLGDLHPLGDAELDEGHLRPMQDVTVSYESIRSKPSAREVLHVGDADLMNYDVSLTMNFDYPNCGVNNVLEDPKGTFVLFTGVSDDMIEERGCMSGQVALLIGRTNQKRTFRRLGTLHLNAEMGDLRHRQAQILGKRGEKLREALESYTPRTIILV